MGVNVDRFKKAFTGNVSPDLLAGRQEKVRAALQELKTASDTLAATDTMKIGTKLPELQAAVDSWSDLNTRFKNTINSNNTREQIYADLDAIKDEARTAAAAATAAKQKELARAALFRAKAQELQETDPTFLKKLAALNGGGAVIDALVADLKGQADTPEKQEFVKQAILARFKMTALEADLKKKGLPQLYKVLGMVPESHTRNNPKLKEIVLNAGDGSGDYLAGKLTLNCNIADEERASSSRFVFDPEDKVKPEWRAKGDPHTRFDEVTLHEMGHAVDDTMTFMQNRFNNPNFGGWNKVDVTDIATEAATKFGFFTQWKTYSRAMLVMMVKMAMSGGKINKGFWVETKQKADEAPSRAELLNDRAVQAAEAERARLAQAPEWNTEAANNFIGPRSDKKGQAYYVVKDVIDEILMKRLEAAAAVDAVLARLDDVDDPPSEHDWDLMMAHPIFTWCDAVRNPNAWKKGAAQAKKAALGSKVCTRDKSGWYQYDLAVRSKSISTYQFNTPAEWFAELYAAFYLKKLPEAHPDYKWMKDQVHNYAG